MHVVVAGHVDHGKSTVIGRMLADTGSLPEGKLEQVRARCERHSKPFEYAFLLDALKDEQAQGITIDAARIFFKSPKREYLILDAPGHVEFLKNMITGASHAEAALLVIDAKEGVRENSRRHGYMLAMLGIRQIAVVVNKLDLVGYDRDRFAEVAREYTHFLDDIGMIPSVIVPVSGIEGQNVATSSTTMPWYDGPTVLEALDAFEAEPPPVEQPLRMPVQGVYKFTRRGDDRRIVAGTIESGQLAVGDDVVFYPSGKVSRVVSIESFNRDTVTTATVGEAAGFTLDEQIFVGRGEVVSRADESRPDVSTRLRVSLFWLGHEPLNREKEYTFRLGTAKVPMRIEEIDRVIDASSLDGREDANQINRHEVADCVLRLRRPVAFDATDANPITSRFVIVDDFDIRGGGIVREALVDSQAQMRDLVFLRNYRWEKSHVSAADRAMRYGQRAALVLVTGPPEGARKEVAKALEERLFEEGRFVYYLGFGSVLYGIDADVDRRDEALHSELIRRLGEVAHIMLDSGVILIVTAQELTRDDLAVLRTVVDPALIRTVWVGERPPSTYRVDVHLAEAERDAVERVCDLFDD